MCNIQFHDLQEGRVESTVFDSKDLLVDSRSEAEEQGLDVLSNSIRYHYPLDKELGN